MMKAIVDFDKIVARPSLQIINKLESAKTAIQNDPSSVVSFFVSSDHRSVNYFLNSRVRYGDFFTKSDTADANTYYSMYELFRTECHLSSVPKVVCLGVIAKTNAMIFEMEHLARQFSFKSPDFDVSYNTGHIIQMVDAIISLFNSCFNESSDRRDDGSTGPQSDDCRVFRLNGSEHLLTPTQAVIIKIFWQHYKKGINCVAQDTVLAEADSKSKRLKDIFKTLYHILFKKCTRKGMYSLNIIDNNHHVTHGVTDLS